MAEFDTKLLKSLGETCDPHNNDSMEICGGLARLKFDVQGLEDIYKFRNAVFKILMLRAIDNYRGTDQGKLPESDRRAVTTLTMNLRADTMHSHEELAERGVNMPEDVIPIIDSLPSDSAEVLAILDLIANGTLSLACN